MKLSGIMIGSAEPKRLTDYYRDVFGAPIWDEDGFVVWEFDGGAGVAVGPHDKVTGPNATPGRVIWNLESTDFQADYDRLVANGATVVAEPYDPMGGTSDMRIATFADPDDNYFQLVTPMEMPEG